MTSNTESELRIQSQLEFWVLVAASAGLVGVSTLGLALYCYFIRLFS